MGDTFEPTPVRSPEFADAVRETLRLVEEEDGPWWISGLCDRVAERMGVVR